MEAREPRGKPIQAATPRDRIGAMDQFSVFSPDFQLQGHNLSV